MQRLIEYQQVRVLYKRTSQQYKTLLTARHLKELPVGQLLDAEQIHPFYAFILFLFVGLVVQTDSVFQSACHYLYGRDVLLVATVHLWRYVAYVALYNPNTFSAATLLSKERDVACIALWVIGTYKRK